eukprot:CAMPEP_0173321674 /NCGR_PEP_ID=MMETSP1143-20121109/29538_1 /TAXON_ID=483371 /ORGANISM="non described non described, Strain CCMP2298" /LENGTH=131 /DNA_ID=CAMNT_0014265445 /DNA_START=194 /DNA_END=585 /DNA_ORIENTATION=+
MTYDLWTYEGGSHGTLQLAASSSQLLAHRVAHTPYAYSVKHIVWGMQYAECSIQHTAYSIQHVVCSMQNAAYSIQHVVCSIQHAVHSIQHTACSVQRVVRVHAPRDGHSPLTTQSQHPSLSKTPYPPIPPT